MLENEDSILFKKGGKDFTFQDLMKDIYQNTAKKRNNIDDIITSIAEQLKKSPETAALIAGVIPMYLNASIKNEEQLTKLAAIAQRMFNKNDSSQAFGHGLSDEEKDELISNHMAQNQSGGDQK